MSSRYYLLLRGDSFEFICQLMRYFFDVYFSRNADDTGRRSIVLLAAGIREQAFDVIRRLLSAISMALNHRLRGLRLDSATPCQTPSLVLPPSLLPVATPNNILFV